MRLRTHYDFLIATASADEAVSARYFESARVQRAQRRGECSAMARRAAIVIAATRHTFVITLIQIRHY